MVEEVWCVEVFEVLFGEDVGVGFFDVCEEGVEYCGFFVECLDFYVFVFFEEVVVW